LISVPIGTLLAMLLVRTNLPGRKCFAACLAGPLFVPLYLQAAGWLAGFGPQGWYPLAVGVGPWLEGWRGAIWIHAMAAIPWVFVIVAAGLVFVEPELEESALIDGSPLSVFWHVTLPRSIAAVAAACLWIGIVTAGEMTVTDFFQVRTYAEEIYIQISLGAQLDELAVGWLPSLGLVAALTAAGIVFCVRLAPAMRWPTWQRLPVFPLGTWRWPLGILVGLIVMLLVGLPLANLVYKAGLLTEQSAEGVVRSWSPLKALSITFASPQRYSREFGWSLGVGSLAATAAVVAGAVMAWSARLSRTCAALTLVVLAACLTLPGPLLGLGLIWLLNRPELPELADLYDYSILAPWLALTVRALPPATLVAWHALRSIPQEQLELALLEGAGPITRLVSIALPQRRTALVAAWLIAFAVALGDLAASILVLPPSVETVSFQIFRMLHYGQEDHIAGICLAMIALFAALAVVLMKLNSLVGAAARDGV
jgi:iron(III) transport system permease protein